MFLKVKYYCYKYKKDTLISANIVILILFKKFLSQAREISENAAAMSSQ